MEAQEGAMAAADQQQQQQQQQSWAAQRAAGRIQFPRNGEAAPAALHGTVLLGPTVAAGPVKLPRSDGGSAAAAAAAAAAANLSSGMVPFPQQARATGRLLETHLSNSGLLPMESAALPSAASAPLPAQRSPLQAAGADCDGSTEQTETTTMDGDGASLGESQRRRAGASQARSRSRSRPASTDARKSQYRGVQWEKSCGKWRARIHTDKTRHIGYFDDEEAAAQAWDAAALKHFGLSWKPKLNFPELSVQRFQAGEAAGAAGAGGSGSGGLERGNSVKMYRGVQQFENKFKAVVQKKRAYIVVGVYDTAEEAARAYDRESLRVNGRGAITNFPLSDYALELDRWQAAYLVTASSQQLSGPLPSMPPLGAGPSEQLPYVHNMHSNNMHSNNSVGGLGAAELAGGAHAQSGDPGSTYKKRRGDPLARDPSLTLASAQTLSLGLGLGLGLDGSTAGGPCEGMTGVVRRGDKYQAFLTLDLGTFDSPQEAAKAHDRASLLLRGFAGTLNSSLPETMRDIRATCLANSDAQQQQQQQQQRGGLPGEQPSSAQQQQQQQQPSRYHGVAARGDVYLALLEIGGMPYDLGPFPTEMAAARAYDRYSLLLHGFSAPTNFPPWTYLAAEPEVQAISEAVLAAARSKQEQQRPQSPPALLPAIPRQQPPPPQQQQQEAAAGLGGGGQGWFFQPLQSLLQGGGLGGLGTSAEALARAAASLPSSPLPLQQQQEAAAAAGLNDSAAAAAAAAAQQAHHPQVKQEPQRHMSPRRPVRVNSGQPQVSPMFLQAQQGSHGAQQAQQAQQVPSPPGLLPPSSADAMQPLFSSTPGLDLGAIPMLSSPLGFISSKELEGLASLGLASLGLASMGLASMGSPPQPPEAGGQLPCGTTSSPFNFLLHPPSLQHKAGSGQGPSSGSRPAG